MKRRGNWATTTRFAWAVFPLLWLASTSASAELVRNTMFRVGAAPISGGYENLVLVGKTDRGELVVVAGGNHASGADLGFTFPWYTVESSRLVGMGFNDLIVMVGDKKYIYQRKFKRATDDDAPPPILRIAWNSAGRDRTPHKRGWICEIDAEFFGNEATVDANGNITRVAKESVRVALRLKTDCGGGLRIAERNEGFKRYAQVTPEPLTPILDSIRGWVDRTLVSTLRSYMPGIHLTENPLRPDSRGESSIVIGAGTTSRRHKVAAFRGGLERSMMVNIAFKDTRLALHLSYDYVALFPDQRDARCKDRDGVVAYMSALLNREQSPVHRLVSDKVGKEHGSSAFWVAVNGADKAISGFERGGYFKTNRELEQNTRLGFREVRTVVGGSAFFHNMGTGTFNRRIIAASRDGCRFFGMFETQSRN